MTILRAIALTVVFFAVSIPAEAKGRCDGYQACRCGVTAARRHGLPVDYNGMNLKMARTYYQFPRTSCRPGAVAIPHAHHVMTIEQCHGDGTALVSDKTGSYTRSIRGATLVEVPSGGFTQTAGASRQRRTTTYHAKATRMRYAEAVFSMPDIAKGAH